MNGQLAVSRAFGDKSLKSHLRSDPDVRDADINFDTDILILASDGLWKVIFPPCSICFYHTQVQMTRFKFNVQFIQVMENQEAVDIARKYRDPQKAAKQLTAEALMRESKDDISCVVVRFRS